MKAAWTSETLVSYPSVIRRNNPRPPCIGFEARGNVEVVRNWDCTNSFEVDSLYQDLANVRQGTGEVYGMSAIFSGPFISWRYVKYVVCKSSLNKLRNKQTVT